MYTVFIFLIGIAIGGSSIFFILKSQKDKKRHRFSRISIGGLLKYSSNSTGKGVTSDDILSHMQFLYKNYGKVAIEFMDDDEIHLTSLETLKDKQSEAKLDEIKEMIKKIL